MCDFSRQTKGRGDNTPAETCLNTLETQLALLKFPERHWVEQDRGRAGRGGVWFLRYPYGSVAFVVLAILLYFLFGGMVVGGMNGVIYIVPVAIIEGLFYRSDEGSNVLLRRLDAIF